jgi:diguanylate cyclase (GGDEF)-like protein
MTLELQNAILEMIARGETLEATIGSLCRQVEAIAPEAVCSVLAVEDRRLRTLASPSLPAGFSAAIDGLEIGPLVGSCGTAAFSGEPVIVTDIATDRRWTHYRDLALGFGFKACWSTPILTGSKVVGTFAFYFAEQRGPTPREQQVVDACVHLCAIAIERNQRVMERERLTYTDWLTGLPNRVCFHKRLLEFSASREPWAILLLDLDNLKMVNDTFGHAAGDDLIKTVAQRLSSENSIYEAFRLGGDEFAIIILGNDRRNNLGRCAAGILETLNRKAECGGHVVFPAATIGGARNDQAVSPDLVLKNADIALYHAKERRRGHFIEYSATLGTSITRRFRAIRDAEIALRQGRMHAFYQPIVRLETKQIVGFEALCRMQMSNGEFVAAATFHEATKDAKIASDLTQRMLIQVAGDIRTWLNDGLPLQHVGINISAADLHVGDLSARLCETFADAGVSLEHVILEVTESVYLGQRNNEIAEQIRKLRAQGLRVALDDFGTGFASLTHLLTMPVDVIKIDKSFIDRLGPLEPASFIVEGVVQIARKMGIRVVAEGIETIEQADRLLNLGCVLGQGYVFSKAVDREAAADLLHRFGQVSGQDEPKRMQAGHHR